MGCDGLWDHVSEDSAALRIYSVLDEVAEHKDDPNLSTGKFFFFHNFMIITILRRENGRLFIPQFKLNC